MFHVTRQRNKFRSNRNIFASRIRGLRRPPRKKRFPPSPKIPPPPSRHLRSFESRVRPPPRAPLSFAWNEWFMRVEADAPPGSRTRAESPGAVKTAMFYIIYLPCLPLSTVIYAPLPGWFRIRRGGRDPSVRGGTAHLSRHAPRAKTCDQRGLAARIYLRVGERRWCLVHGFVKTVCIYSSRVNFEGVVLNRLVDKSGFLVFLVFLCQAGSKWMGFWVVGMTRSFFLRNEFEDSRANSEILPSKEQGIYLPDSLGLLIEY